MRTIKYKNGVCFGYFFYKNYYFYKIAKSVIAYK